MSDLSEESLIPDQNNSSTLSCYSFWFFLFTFLLFFPSCQKITSSNKFDGKSSLVSDKNAANGLQENADIQLQQAKLSNILVPVGYNLISSKSNDNLSLFCYEGGLSVDQVLGFYNQNMERLGWDISNLSTDNEGLLLCHKPKKTCVISIREIDMAKKDSKIYLFLKDKESGLRVSDVAVDINAKQVPLI